MPFTCNYCERVIPQDQETWAVCMYCNRHAGKTKIPEAYEYTLIYKIARENKQKMDIDDTLKERGERYGEFPDHADISQALKDVMRATPGWNKLTNYMREALEMNAHKTARILNGDSTFHDSWHDIVGYTKLVADELLKFKPEK